MITFGNSEYAVPLRQISLVLEPQLTLLFAETVMLLLADDRVDGCVQGGEEEDEKCVRECFRGQAGAYPPRPSRSFEHEGMAGGSAVR